MYTFNGNNISVTVSYEKGCVTSLVLDGKERVSAYTPIFKVGMRNDGGEATVFSAFDAKKCTVKENRAEYSDFGVALGDIKVSVELKAEEGEAAWYISVTPGSMGMLVEWVDFPLIVLPALRENNEKCEGGEILFPFNEGCIVSDIRQREERYFKYEEPEYPSKGSFSVFPNMLCSQMISYHWDNCGLYVGAHDKHRGVKYIDFHREGEGIAIQMRLYSGCDRGQTFMNDYPIIWSAVSGYWESAAERYRAWFEDALPAGAKRICENDRLPEWYGDSPLVVTYPIRGKYDMDEMSPNALYPYTNALPIIDDIKKSTDSRLLVLLMHWEGTAPWAPPYVWPPYGDTDNFQSFMDALHSNGDKIGVYCSGFGYTLQSNLISEYNKRAEYEERELSSAMCAGPDGNVGISRICTGQRAGYDVCPASKQGRAILSEAYAPLFNSGVDYAQILDQNHGGGQYFCYSKDHGHPAAPGRWMTENMQNMLSEWNESAPDMLFGCESAAAEPFIGNLHFSDNRFELCYIIGRAVPLYSYIYHEYLRNFMGNQVSCPFMPDEDTLGYRIAYSYAAGDSMTLVLSPDGELMPSWGMPRYTVAPNKKKILSLVANLTARYKSGAKQYLYNGRMITPMPIECDSIVFNKRASAFTTTLPSVVTTAWESENGKRAQILVNPLDREQICRINGKSITIPALDACIIEI